MLSATVTAFVLAVGSPHHVQDEDATDAAPSSEFVTTLAPAVESPDAAEDAPNSRPPRVVPGDPVVYRVRIFKQTDELIPVDYGGEYRPVLLRDGRPVPLTAYGEQVRERNTAANRSGWGGGGAVIQPGGTPVTVVALPVHQLFDLSLPGRYDLSVRDLGDTVGPVSFVVNEKGVAETGNPLNKAQLCGQVVSPDGKSRGETRWDMRAGLQVLAPPPPEPPLRRTSREAPSDFEAGQAVTVRISLNKVPGTGVRTLPMGPLETLWRFEVTRLEPSGELPAGPLPLTEWGRRQFAGGFGELRSDEWRSGGLSDLYLLSRAYDFSQGGRIQIVAERLVVTPAGDLRTLRTNAVIVTVRRPIPVAVNFDGPGT